MKEMKKSRISRVLVAFLIVTGFLFAGCKGKNEYPKGKDITVIVPKGAGGGTDISARGLLQFLKPQLAGSNFVVTNRPDGGGVTGMVQTAQAKADGYTLGMVTVELAMFPHQGKTTLTNKDFEAIAATIAAPAALIVPKNAPYNSVAEFVEYVKKNPNTVQTANSGTGAIWHVAAIMFEEAYGVQLKHIPYPNGSADIAAALAGKHVDATIADPSNFKSQIEAGNLKILAVMAAERSELYPNVPTFKELGHDLRIRAWAALVAPKNTPADVLKMLRDSASKVVTSKEFKEYAMKQGIDPVNIVGEECNKMMKDDHAMYERILKSLNK